MNLLKTDRILNISDYSFSAIISLQLSAKYRGVVSRGLAGKASPAMREAGANPAHIPRYCIYASPLFLWSDPVTVHHGKAEKRTQNRKVPNV